MSSIIQIGGVVICWLCLLACTSFHTDSHPQSSTGAAVQTSSGDRPSDSLPQDTIYTLERVYALAGKNNPMVHTILDSIDRREKKAHYANGIPAYKIQIARAFVASRDLNPGLAIRYLRPLLSSEELTENPESHLFALALLCNECNVLHLADQSLSYALQYLELTHQYGDSVRYAAAHLYLAELYRQQGNPNKGYDHLREGQQILKQTQDPRTLGYLLWSRELEINYFADQKQYDQAITLVQKLIVRYRALSPKQRHQLQLDNDSVLNFRQAQNLVTLAGLYAHDGQMNLARKTYQEAQQYAAKAPDILSPEFAGLTFDYLKTAGRYNEALACAIRYVNQTRTGDTLNLFHLEAKRFLAQAYRLTGDYSKAWFYEHQVGILADSLNERANQQAALELQTAYETAQQQQQIQQQHLTITRNRQIITTLLITLVALLLILGQIILSRHRISRKNRKLFEQIERLSQAQKKLDRIRQLMERETTDTVNSTEKNNLFDRLETLMRERQLFLQPDLTREQVAAELGTNKLYLANAISQQVNLTFTEYINRWRLQQAQELLLKDHTTKIEAIAHMCGFNSVRTFYRLFQQTYQLTPTEFRRLSKIGEPPSLH